MKVYIQTAQNVYEVDDPRATKIEDIVIPQEYKDEGLEGVFNAAENHICKYCHSVAPGTYEDLLCDDCREIFGHALYSEL